MSQVTVQGGWGDVIQWHLVAGLLYGGLVAFFWRGRHRVWVRSFGALLILAWFLVTVIAHREFVIVTH